MTRSHRAVLPAVVVALVATVPAAAATAQQGAPEAATAQTRSRARRRAASEGVPIRSGRVAVNTTADRPDVNVGDGFCADSAGRCSLRAAAMEAGEVRDGLRISLQAGRKYTLGIAGAAEDRAATGDLDVSTRVTLIGRNAIVDANRADRAFDVAAGARLVLGRARVANGAPPAGESGGAIRSAGSVELKGGTRVTKSAVTGDGASGGGVMNDRGTLIVRDSQVNRNSAPRAGGGIEANEGTTLLRRASLLVNTTAGGPGNGGGLHLTGRGIVDVRDSLVDRNVASAEGGGLWNSAAGAMSVADTTVTRNRADGAAADNGGGGIFNDGGRLRVDRGTIRENAAAGAAGSGGGLFNANGTALVLGTEIRSNNAKRAGGGVEAIGGSTSLGGVTLADNRTGNAPGNGGGLHLTGGGQVAVTGGTVTGNTAASEGGGLWNSSTGNMTVTDASVSGNTAYGSPADQGGGGLFNDGGRLHVLRGVVADNRATGAAGSGGGLLNDRGQLIVEGTEVRGNSAPRAGGGIEANVGSTVVAGAKLNGNATGAAPGNGGALHLTGAGTVEVRDTEVRGNTAAAEGGGLWNSAAGTMTAARLTVVGNRADGAGADQGGGGLFNDGGRLTVDGGTIADNSAPGAAGSGGGILNDRGVLTVTGSELRANAARRAGGGIETNIGTVALTGVRLLANTTGDRPGNGGGFHTTGAGVVTIADGTVTGNVASREGGGLWNSATGTMTVTRTTIAGNSAPTGPQVFNLPPGGTFTIDGTPVPAG